jgi:RNA recognition motif-containing protein
MDIFVGNLPTDINPNDLREIFEKFGQVLDVRLIKDQTSGKFKRYAFVEMSSEEEAKKAIEETNGTELKEMELTVKEANPKRPRSRKSKKKRGGRKRGGKRAKRSVYGGEDRDDITSVRRRRRGKI